MVHTLVINSWCTFCYFLEILLYYDYMIEIQGRGTTLLLLVNQQILDQRNGTMLPQLYQRLKSEVPKMLHWWLPYKRK